jgi:uncharacterized membrane protein YphA (DoxX/SURF4 family)
MFIAGLTVRLLVGAVLTLAGAGKLLGESGARTKWLQAYGLIPTPLVPAIAVGLASLELLAGAALVLGFGGRLSVAVAGATMALITGGAAVTLARGKHPDCGCFGRWARDQLSWKVVVRNLALIGLLALIGTFGLTQPGIAGLPIAAQVLLLVALAAALYLVPRAAVARPSAHRTMPSLSPATKEA